MRLLPVAIVASLILLAAPPAMPQAVPRDVYQVLVRSQRAMDAHNYKRAEEILQRFLKREGKGGGHPLVYYYLGTCLHAEGHIRRAYDIFKTGNEAVPDSFPLVLNQAVTAFELKRYPEAARLFQKAFRLSDPPDPGLLYSSAAAAFEAMDYGMAVRVFRVLVREHPGAVKPDWLPVYVQACTKTGCVQEAIEYLEEFVQRIPGKPLPWKLLAQARLLERQYLEAGAALETAYDLDSPGPGDWERLADIYLSGNARLEAARCLEKAWLPDPSAKQCDRLAGIYLQAHRPDMAFHYMDMAIEKAPSAQRYFMKGRIAYDHGLPKQAAEAFRTAMKMGIRERGLCSLLLSLCAIETRDLAGARNALNTALKSGEYKREAEAVLAFLEDLQEKNM